MAQPRPAIAEGKQSAGAGNGGCNDWRVATVPAERLGLTALTWVKMVSPMANMSIAGLEVFVVGCIV